MSNAPRYHEDPMLCACFYWARICLAPGELALHHKDCPMFDAEEVERTKKALRATGWSIVNDR